METTLDWRRSFPAMETALDASGAGFGVFWGSQETGDDSCASKPQTAGRTARSVTSARRLPPIPGHSSSRLVVASVSTPILSPPGVRAALSPSDRTPTTLLDVLHTLLTNIRRNSSRFMKDTFGTASRVGGAGSGSSTLSRGSSQQHCYIPPPPGVEVEDREFFEQEQALTADREAFFAAVGVYSGSPIVILKLTLSVLVCGRPDDAGEEAALRTGRSPDVPLRPLSLSLEEITSPASQWQVRLARALQFASSAS